MRPLSAVRVDSNALTSMRLALALTVLVVHSWTLGGFDRPPSLGPLSWGSIAVYGFFVLSGYLVAGSRLSLSLGRYAWHRALRIYPGMWVALAVTAFVLAPASALLDGRYDARSACRYFAFNATSYIEQLGIAGSLLNVPRGASFGAPWNGSLWTLVYEVGCYVGLGLLLTSRAIRRPATLWGAVAVLTVASVVDIGPPEAVRLGVLFAAGAALRITDHKVPLDWRLAAVAAAVSVASIHQGRVVPVAVPLAYALLWASASVPQWLKGWRADYSYGTYIYSFPVQQLLATAGVHHGGIAAYAAASVVCTAPFALASWWLIERPASRLRDAGAAPVSIRVADVNHRAVA